jgi:hypothetical protein
LTEKSLEEVKMGDEATCGNCVYAVKGDGETPTDRICHGLPPESVRTVIGSSPLDVYPFRPIVTEADVACSLWKAQLRSED